MSLLPLIDSIQTIVNRWKYPHSSRTFLYSEKNIKHVNYYNVNYFCNSKCVFCASDLTSNKKLGLMSYQDIHESLNNSLTDSGNAVVFNGGEATLFLGLSDLIETVSLLESQVVLFTNGRKFANYSFAKNVLSNVTRVTIPLYGTNSTDHDRMTATIGSFKETVQGIKNIMALKKNTLPSLLLELKCLTVKPCLDQIPKIIDFIIHDFGLPDRFVLSGIIPSQKVLSKSDIVLPDWDSLRSSVRESFNSLMEHGFQVISLPDLPLCLLGMEQLEYYLMRNKEEDDLCPSVDFLYFDAFNPRGVVPRAECKKPSICSDCILAGICDADNAFLKRIDPNLKNLEVEKSQLLRY